MTGRPPKLLLLKTGEAVDAVVHRRGGFYPLFREGLGAGGRGVELSLIDITARDHDDPLPSLAEIDGVVMTGSAAMVGEDLPWMRYGARLIRHLLDVEVPFLGVCFGHQLLGVAVGADVGPNPRGREMGTATVELASPGVDPLLASLPARFAAQVSHVDVIRETRGALEVIGQSAHDPCHVVRAGRWSWGVQFHPEFDVEVMRLYLESRRDAMDRDRGDGATEARLSALAPSPDAASLLERFARLCASRRDGTTGAVEEVRDAS